MCVIAYKPKGSELTWEVMQECFASNRDGAGFMYRDADGMIQAEKGFMTLAELFLAMDTHGLCDSKTDNVTSEFEVGVHFRIATHGGVCKENTHPFPLSSKKKLLRSLTWKRSVGIMHNGILAGYDAKGDLSDTQQFVKEVLSKAAIKDNIADKGILNLISRSIGSSKFLIMSPTSNSLIGKWIHDKELGCYFSNDTYKPWISGYSSYNAWGSSTIPKSNKTAMDYWDDAARTAMASALSSTSSKKDLVDTLAKSPADLSPLVPAGSMPIESYDDSWDTEEEYEKLYEWCFYHDNCSDCHFYGKPDHCMVWDNYL